MAAKVERALNLTGACTAAFAQPSSMYLYDSKYGVFEDRTNDTGSDECNLFGIADRLETLHRGAASVHSLFRRRKCTKGCSKSRLAISSLESFNVLFHFQIISLQMLFNLCSERSTSSQPVITLSAGFDTTSVTNAESDTPASPAYRDTQAHSASGPHP